MQGVTPPNNEEVQFLQRLVKFTLLEIKATQPRASVRYFLEAALDWWRDICTEENTYLKKLSLRAFISPLNKASLPVLKTIITYVTLLQQTIPPTKLTPQDDRKRLGSINELRRMMRDRLASRFDAVGPPVGSHIASRLVTFTFQPNKDYHNEKWNPTEDIGITFSPPSPSIGAQVAKVVPGTPAARADVQTGWKIWKVELGDEYAPYGDTDQIPHSLDRLDYVKITFSKWDLQNSGSRQKADKKPLWLLSPADFAEETKLRRRGASTALQPTGSTPLDRSPPRRYSSRPEGDKEKSWLHSPATFAEGANSRRLGGSAALQPTGPTPLDRSPRRRRMGLRF